MVVAAFSFFSVRSVEDASMTSLTSKGPAPYHMGLSSQSSNVPAV